MQYFVDRLALLDSIFMARIYYLQEQVGIDNLFKRSAKCRDQLSRQFLDKTNGVGVQHLLVAW